MRELSGVTRYSLPGQGAWGMQVCAFAKTDRLARLGPMHFLLPHDAIPTPRTPTLGSTSKENKGTTDKSLQVTRCT